LFHPRRRKRADGEFVIGYVGRLTKEKNVRFLRDLEEALSTRGGRSFKIVVVGQGSEFEWMRKHLRRATFAGVLRGEQLAEAYANFDAFVFPSHTDTFGNVVLESLAAGVPAVVTGDGGPKFIVEHQNSGFVAHSDTEFIEYVDKLRRDPDLLSQMRSAARRRAEQAPSWDSVFNSVYGVYQEVVLHPAKGCAIPTAHPAVSAVRYSTKPDAQLG
jgi:phosphatidylinositol alpha 1,6-mannosyltransferase